MSIHTIVKTYPDFKTPKWVCIYLVVLTGMLHLLKVSERVDILLVSFYSRATWLLDLSYSTADL